MNPLLSDNVFKVNKGKFLYMSRYTCRGTLMLQAEEDLLVIAAQSGNHKAFNVLVVKYQKPLLRFANRLCNDPELANDAVQDCWIKSTKTLRQLKDPRAFKSWIYRLVKWRVTDLLRFKVKHKARFGAELHELDEQLLDEKKFIESAHLKQGDLKQSGLKQSEIGMAIDKLPKVEKEIIHLFYLDEMKVAEVAIILGIPTGTVKSRLNRARALLKQKCNVSDDG